MEEILFFNRVILPFFGHDFQKMKKNIIFPVWLDYGITELVKGNCCNTHSYTVL